MTEQKDLITTKLGEKLYKLNVEDKLSLEIESKIDETVDQLNDLINKTIDGANIAESDIIKKHSLLLSWTYVIVSLLARILNPIVFSDFCVVDI